MRTVKPHCNDRVIGNDVATNPCHTEPLPLQTV